MDDWKLAGTYKHKRKALKEAQKLREKGNMARTMPTTSKHRIKHHTKYDVWTKKR